MSVHGERFLRFSIAEIRQIGANSFAFPPFSFSRASSRAVYPSSSLKLLYASNWDTCQLELVTVAREKGWKGCRGRGRGKKKKQNEEEAKIQVSIEGGRKRLVQDKGWSYRSFSRAHCFLFFRALKRRPITYRALGRPARTRPDHGRYFDFSCSFGHFRVGK